MSTGTWITAGTLFGVAKKAYRRTEGAASDRAPGQPDALVAVIFAVVAMEAFINEIAELASHPHPVPEPPSIAVLANLLTEAEQGSLQLKFSIGKAVLDDVPYDKGGQPFQHFQLLVSLRNQLVHYRELNRLTGVLAMEPSTPPAIVNNLRSINILAEYPADSNPQPIGYFETRAVGQWACNVASKMVYSILDVVPESELKKGTELFYRRNFEAVD